MKMNTYEVDGLRYEALNEYNAIKQAYKMAMRIEWDGYLGNDNWIYNAIFNNGIAKVHVCKI